MAEKNRNLVEEALLQMKNLEEAVTQNAKGILASTMKQEISDLVKESLSEEDMEIEDEMSMETMESKKTKKGGKMSHEMKEQDELEMEDEMDMEVEDEMEMDSDEMEMDSDEMEDEMEMDSDEMEMDSDEMLMMNLPDGDMDMDDEEVLLPLDLTDASDEEILKVFKAMGDEDGIIVTKDDDEITLKDDQTDAEYKIQMEAEEEDVTMTDEEMEGYEMEEEDEVIYEIELDEEEDEYEEEMGEGYNSDLDDSLGMKDHGKKMRQSFADRRKESEGMKKAMGKKKYSGDMSMDEMEKMEGEYKEGMVRSHAAGQKASSDKSKGLPKPHSIPNKSRYNESLEKEVSQLRQKNEEYRKALNIFKEKLNEVAIFNSNLAYATRLFTEHSTTKQEKINILRRFDSAETIKESKNLYKTIKEDLTAKESPSVVNESIDAKIQKSPSRGSASSLIESKTYENPQFLRMKDLMNKLQK
jgi:hypothetical protein